MMKFRLLFIFGFLLNIALGVWVPKMDAVNASIWTKDLVGITCGNDFFQNTSEVKVCEGMTPEDAAKIVGVLCLQF
jgi:hypothetical protein